MKKIQRFAWFAQRLSNVSKLKKPQPQASKPGKSHGSSVIVHRPNLPNNFWYDWYRQREQDKASLVATYFLNTSKFARLLKKFIPGLYTSPIRRNVNRKMENIDNVVVGPMPASNFVQPFRMTFKQNGVDRYWDFVKLHESVSVIIFNKSRDVLVLVKQFRPAVYFGSIPPVMKNPTLNPKAKDPSFDIDWAKFPAMNGITLEMCAGIVDKPTLTTAEIAKQEVFEECGYDVPLNGLELVISFVSGVGISGETQTMYYVEVTDSMRTGKGGGNLEEGEFIDIIELTIPDLKKYMSQSVIKSPSSFLFGMTWFLLNKVKAH